MLRVALSAWIAAHATASVSAMPVTTEPSGRITVQRQKPKMRERRHRVRKERTAERDGWTPRPAGSTIGVATHPMERGMLPNDVAVALDVLRLEVAMLRSAVTALAAGAPEPVRLAAAMRVRQAGQAFKPLSSNADQGAVRRAAAGLAEEYAGLLTG